MANLFDPIQYIYFFSLPDSFCLTDEFEDTKEVIRIRKLKDRQHNYQKKKDKRTSNDLQSPSHKAKA